MVDDLIRSDVRSALQGVSSQIGVVGCKFCHDEGCVVCRSSEPAAFQIASHQNEAKRFVECLINGKSAGLADLLSGREWTEEALLIIGLAVDYGKRQERNRGRRQEPPTSGLKGRLERLELV